MNGVNLPETIRFLQFIQRDRDPEELVQQILEEKNREIDEQFRLAISSILSEQATIEKQIEELVEQMGCKDWRQPRKEQCTAAQQRIDELGTAQMQLQQILAQTQSNLRLHRANIQALHRGVQQLNKQLDHVPSPYEAPLLELGQKTCNFLNQS